MTDQEYPNHSIRSSSGLQDVEIAPKAKDVNIEELAKEIWKLLKTNLREENERMARK